MYPNKLPPRQNPPPPRAVAEALWRAITDRSASAHQQRDETAVRVITKIIEQFEADNPRLARKGVTS